MRSRRLGGGLHGTQVVAASRVLLLLDDGGGHGEAGHRLLTLHAPDFCLCLHGVAIGTGGTAVGTGSTPTDTGGAATADTGGAVRRGRDCAHIGMEQSKIIDTT